MSLPKLGIEQLSSLQELDIAYNCVANGEALSALCSLSHLVKLCLESNPICYSKDYRLTVVRRLSAAVNKKKVNILLCRTSDVLNIHFLISVLFGWTTTNTNRKRFAGNDGHPLSWPTRVGWKLAYISPASADYRTGSVDYRRSRKVTSTINTC